MTSAPAEPRPLGRCARSVPLSPNESRCPNGRGSAAFGAAVVRRLRSGLSGTRIALQTPPPRQRPSCERSPPFIPTWALAFGAAALVRALLVLKLPLRVPSGAAFICASRSSNGRDWDSQPRAGPCGRRGPLRAARPLAALRVRASRSGNPTPSARANLAVPSAPSLRFAPAHPPSALP